MDFDLDCIIERTECADPYDCDPQCTGSQSSAGEIDEDPWLILGGDPCDNDPDCSPSSSSEKEGAHLQEWEPAQCRQSGYHCSKCVDPMTC